MGKSWFFVLFFQFSALSSYIQLYLQDPLVPHADLVAVVALVGMKVLEQQEVVQVEVVLDEQEGPPVKQEEQLQEELIFPPGASSAIHSGPVQGWTPSARSWLEFELRIKMT